MPLTYRSNQVLRSVFASQGYAVAFRNEQRDKNVHIERTKLADIMLLCPIIQQPLSLPHAHTVNNKRPYYTYSRPCHPL